MIAAIFTTSRSRHSRARAELGDIGFKESKNKRQKPKKSTDAISQLVKVPLGCFVMISDCLIFSSSSISLARLLWCFVKRVIQGLCLTFGSRHHQS